MDEDRWCEEDHYSEAISELKIYGFSEEQYDNFQRAMIHQEKYPTSGDRYILFRFHIDWLKE
jgi:hypothetical protein